MEILTRKDLGPSLFEKQLVKFTEANKDKLPVKSNKPEFINSQIGSRK